MKNKKTIDFMRRLILIASATTLLLVSACEEFVMIDPPRTDLIKATVFESDATANAAMVDVYYQLSSSGFASGGQSSISYLSSYSSDELLNYSAPVKQEFNDNALTPVNDDVLNLWNDLFRAVYRTNAIIEGLSAGSVTEALKTRLEGEAKFIRAYSYFYLVNLFGDVPLVLTTDYKINAAAPRAAKAEVYQQMISDLITARELLPDNYALSGNERVRANKWAATALLARVYLYLGNWSQAEAQASSVINNTTAYSLLTDLSKIMTKNNTEAILQFHNTRYPNDISTFYIFSAPPNAGALRNGFENSFETGDKRRTSWVGSISSGGTTYYFPQKYSSLVQTAEYSTLLRLAEQYLIRSEARTQQDNIVGGQQDINVIRTRAGLVNTTASDKVSLLLAIEQERKAELFTEHGHRWLDLKRTNRADAILAPIKGSNWQPSDMLYPIPQYQILNDPAMSNAQNPGY